MTSEMLISGGGFVAISLSRLRSRVPAVEGEGKRGVLEGVVQLERRTRGHSTDIILSGHVDVPQRECT